MSALMRRARDLGRIDERRYKSLNVQISQKGWRKTEPVQVQHEHPTFLPQILGVHHYVHEYDVAALAKMTGLHEAEYSQRFDDYPRQKLRLMK